MNIEYTYEISPVWELIETIETKTDEIFKIEDADLKHATLMVISELLENAVKYGKSNPRINGIQFKFAADDYKILIEVKNGVVANQHIQELINHIDKVNTSDNPEELYTNRLKELLEHRKSGESKLGIFRIAYEGGFSLRYDYKGNILKITAERAYGKGEKQ